MWHDVPVVAMWFISGDNQIPPAAEMGVQFCRRKGFRSWPGRSESSAWDREGCYRGRGSESEL